MNTVGKFCKRNQRPKPRDSNGLKKERGSSVNEWKKFGRTEIRSGHVFRVTIIRLLTCVRIITKYQILTFYISNGLLESLLVISSLDFFLTYVALG